MTGVPETNVVPKSDVPSSRSRDNRLTILVGLAMIAAGAYFLVDPPNVRFSALVGSALLAIGFVTFLVAVTIEAARQFPLTDWKRGGRYAFVIAVAIGLAIALEQQRWGWAIVSAALLTERWIAMTFRLDWRNQTAINRELLYSGFLSVGVSIPRALEHEAVRSLFVRLKATAQQSQVTEAITPPMFAFSTFEEWKESLLSAWQQAAATASPMASVVFGFRNRTIWKDGVATHERVILHDFLIPEPSMGLDLSGQPVGLKLRVCVVNGYLHLQIGDFGRRLSPEIEELVYRRWQDLATFPLFLWVDVNPMPLRLMNFDLSLEKGWGLASKKAVRNFWNDYQLSLASIEQGGDWNNASRLAKRIAEEFSDRRTNYLVANRFERMGQDGAWHGYQAYSNGLIEVAFRGQDGDRGESSLLKMFSEPHY